MIVGNANAQQEILLYKNEIPNNKKVSDPEYVIDRSSGDRAFFKTAIPTVTIFRPEVSNGKSIVICPGGGYAKTSIDKEGMDVARRLVKDSITAFVLKYRLPQDLINIDKSMAPLQDAQQAIRYVRENAKAYSLNPNRIGIMGFSAGGHLAASAATMLDKSSDGISCRPDFCVLIYPVISFKDEITHQGSRQRLLGNRPHVDQIESWSCELNVSKDTPPTFIVHASDDQSVPVENSLLFYNACLKNDISVEMHLYAKGGHGFGMYNKYIKGTWLDEMINWLKTL